MAVLGIKNKPCLIAPYFLEETEVIESIDQCNWDNLKEELEIMPHIALQVKISKKKEDLLFLMFSQY